MPSNPKPAAVSGPVSIIVVERNGDLRASQIDAYTPLELCKKCKYKTSSGFEIRAEWAYSGPTATDERFMVELWAREDGNAGQENKYEFPPPVDTILFFGACALVAKDMSSHHRVIPLTLEKWDKMYDFLFGGFDTLVNYEDDENEEDELDSIPAHRKTKDGYLKDGFVVDNSGDDDADDDDDDEEDEDEEDEDDEDEDEDEDEDDDADNNNPNDDEADDGVGSGSKSKSKIGSNSKGKPLPKRREKKQEVLVDTSSELGEETYEYFDD
jgi:hypothetical protein